MTGNQQDGAAEEGRHQTRLGQWSWAFYEWARNPYVLLVTIYLFAPYFALAVVGDPVRGQRLWGIFSSGGGFAVAVCAPFLGAVADAGGRRKPWIFLYTLVMAGAMLSMWRATPHASAAGILFAGIMVAVANFAYEFSAVFHNAMLSTIAPPRRIGPLSGLGLALGNAAGLLLLAFMMIAFALPGQVPWSFVPDHALFGIDQAAHEPERLAGPICGLWLLLFSLPLFLFTPDRAAAGIGLAQAFRRGIRSVIATVRSLRAYRNVGHYLGARMLFNDGMTALLTFGGIYAAGTFHWGPLAMTAYGLELSLFAVLGGFFGGWLDNRLGSKRAIFVSVGGTALFLFAGLFTMPDRIFWFAHDVHAPPVNALPFFNTWPEIVYLLTVNCNALCITAAYANARTMMARIAPREKMTEFFGLMSLSGTATGFLANLAVTAATYWTASQRGGLFAILPFFAGGLVWMMFVKEERASAV